MSTKGLKTSVANVTQSVLYCSGFGLFFFTIIINDLPKNISVSSEVSADDT